MIKAGKMCDYFITTAERVFYEQEENKEIKEVVKGGKSVKDKILELNMKGYNNSEISKVVGKSRQYVGKVINSSGIIQ
jgi:hypothetical protein